MDGDSSKEIKPLSSQNGSLFSEFNHQDLQPKSPGSEKAPKELTDRELHLELSTKGINEKHLEFKEDDISHSKLIDAKLQRESLNESEFKHKGLKNSTEGIKDEEQSELVGNVSGHQDVASSQEFKQTDSQSQCLSDESLLGNCIHQEFVSESATSEQSDLNQGGLQGSLGIESKEQLPEEMVDDSKDTNNEKLDQSCSRDKNKEPEEERLDQEKASEAVTEMQPEEVQLDSSGDGSKVELGKLSSNGERKRLEHENILPNSSEDSTNMEQEKDPPSNESKPLKCEEMQLDASGGGTKEEPGDSSGDKTKNLRPEEVQFGSSGNGTEENLQKDSSSNKTENVRPEEMQLNSVEDGAKEELFKNSSCDKAEGLDLEEMESDTSRNGSEEEVGKESSSEEIKMPLQDTSTDVKIEFQNQESLTDSSENETLFKELKQEDLILPLTYVTLRTKVGDYKDCDSGTYCETTTICAVGGYNIHIKTDDNSDSETIVNGQSIVCNSIDIHLTTAPCENDTFGINYEEEPVFVTLTSVKTEAEGKNCLEEDEETDSKTICSLGGYEIDNKSENSQHLLDDSSQMLSEGNKEESDIFEVKRTRATSERDLFNIEFEEEHEYTNLSSGNNESLNYIENETEYYNGYDNEDYSRHEDYSNSAIEENSQVMESNLSDNMNTSNLSDNLSTSNISNLSDALVTSPEQYTYRDGGRKLKGKKTHNCPICGESYTRRFSLEKHLPVHFGYRPYGCYMCKVYFRNRSVRDVHVQQHFANQPFFCHMCMKPFIQLQHFKKHVIVTKGDKPFSCSYCGRCFGDRSALDVHFKCHIAKRPQHCEICRKSFRMKWQYDKHQANKHTGERKKRPYVRKQFLVQVPIAGEIQTVEPVSASGSVQSNEHVPIIGPIPDGERVPNVPTAAHIPSAVRVPNAGRKVAGEHKPRVGRKRAIERKNGGEHKQIKEKKIRRVIKVDKYSCNDCEKTFSDKVSLVLHIEEHSVASIPVECDICKKMFADAKQLEEHAHSHKKNGAYFCDVCKKKYSMKARFYKHKCIQREKRFFSCGYCSQTFKWKSLLESHLSSHEIEVRYSCEICKKGFSTKTSRDMHRRTHKNTYSCRICGKIFNDKVTRDRHLRRHTLQERRSKMLMET